MAYRDRTREFVRRRNARSSRGAGSHVQPINDRDALLSEDEDSPQTTVSLPPEWVDDVEEAREMINTIRTRIKELNQMHNQHINTPNFDEHAEEERKIEIATSEITGMFHRCQKTIQNIGRKGKASGSTQEARVTQNVMRSIAGELQELSQSFRKGQGLYLKRMRGREAKEKDYGFTDELMEMGVDDDEEEDITFDTGFTDTQQQQLRDNTAQIAQREQEITNIVKSINDLALIFKDLAELVVDQGTILDRIDYNLELTERRVESGRRELEQGQKYQKSAAKKYVIILLVLIVVAMLFALILKGKLSGHGGSGSSTSDDDASPTPSSNSGRGVRSLVDSFFSHTLS
ncbi:hypothetical protein PTSG_03656 [Salpingoeca rosetta]|uniref:t-SNARE coiled-coil homology domain-containing protein n=1 Tax=Salpingoeca rosetta (strain ATCC 50818 / BSB-021) TaxID=946362 RepID=F2U679_SALR5|nr:uncharacterized protein PTSG_03656 [Salpingoeca rosetta]EGD83020.1 hypothetical protein PTSG_03656 [Salpingoeca rosetta]|eukprot:XP_004995384.1 hypothetical protein PTSG_03656 [Salpingoeca rosetta]